LAFVGSRPSLARHLLAHAERLFQLAKPVPAGFGGGGSGCGLALAADPSGDRARVANQLAAQTRATARRQQQRAAAAGRVGLRLRCRERALERHRASLAARRRLDRPEVGSSHLHPERQGMASADAESRAARRFLACAWRDVKALEDAFGEFDWDGNGSMDVAELQDLMFALGCVLSDEASEQLADVVDTNRSGSVNFGEFAAWWLVREEDAARGLHALAADGSASHATRKRLASAMKQRRELQQIAALKAAGPATAAKLQGRALTRG
jgi:hypothetical protein